MRMLRIADILKIQIHLKFPNIIKVVIENLRMQLIEILTQEVG